ncbi:MAG: DNA polymerase III subunit delta [bacterium]|nr:DNA polymerase III subunit delta [bacterium]
MSKAAPTFYIFHGDDEMRIEEEVDKMRARMGDTPNADLNTSEFDGERTEAAEVLSSAMAYPFLADKRLVIVKGMLGWITRKGAGETGKKQAERLAADLPTLPEWARVVFCEREKLPDSHKVVKAARESAHGFEKAFDVPKDSTQWILKRAADVYSAQIDPQAAAALATVTGGDLRRADSELFKLVAFVEGARPIRESDVELLTPYVAEATVFQFTDALAEGRGQAAFAALRRLFEQQEDPFQIYGMIVRQFRLLLLAKEHLAGGGSPASVMDVIGVRSSYAADKVARQSRAFSLAQLEKIYRTLQDYDAKMKTGRIKPELAFDLLIGSLTR